MVFDLCHSKHGMGVYLRGDILSGASQYATCLPVPSHREGAFFCLSMCSFRVSVEKQMSLEGDLYQLRSMF